VAAADDQQPVETLDADGADEALGVGVRLWCADGPVLAIVDYAHTAESLASVLASTRSLRPRGKLIVVGGCGGDRDNGKRAEMGTAIATADVPIFTADNPRSKDPRAIIEAMQSNLDPDEQGRVRIDLDRRRAIQHAVQLAEPGDVILLVGKGHETSQEIAGTKHTWDDAAELRHALQQRFTLQRPAELATGAAADNAPTPARA
jgi:UDP-N-acetylmuramoyl-L-alanyl-D-glutamate--2,6-diaminopimelate ligase